MTDESYLPVNRRCTQGLLCWRKLKLSQHTIFRADTLVRLIAIGGTAKLAAL